MKKIKKPNISIFVSALILGVSLLTNVNANTNNKKTTISLAEAQTKLNNKQGKLISNNEYFDLLKKAEMKKMQEHIQNQIDYDKSFKEKNSKLILLKNKEISAVEIAISQELMQAKKDYENALKQINKSKEDRGDTIVLKYDELFKKILKEKSLKELSFNQKSMALKNSILKIDAMKKLKDAQANHQGPKKLTPKGKISLNGIRNIVDYVEKNKNLNQVSLDTTLLDSVKLYKYALDNSWSFSIEKNIVNHIISLAKDDASVDYENFKYIIDQKDSYELKQIIDSLSEEEASNRRNKNLKGIK